MPLDELPTNDETNWSPREINVIDQLQEIKASIEKLLSRAAESGSPLEMTARSSEEASGTYFEKIAAFLRSVANKPQSAKVIAEQTGIPRGAISVILYRTHKDEFISHSVPGFTKKRLWSLKESHGENAQKTQIDKGMDDQQFRAFLDLLMCADPWPVEDESGHEVLLNLAKSEAKRRGFADWIDAFHGFNAHGKSTLFGQEGDLAGVDAAECCFRILKEHKKPLSVLAMTKKALRRGYKARTKGEPDEILFNTAKSFWARLGRDERFVKIRPFVYALKGGWDK